MIAKGASVILIGALMGTLREPFQPAADNDQQDRIRGRQYGLEMKRANQFNLKLLVR